jgi:histone acetyltransferase (RNA polymerase elongator complex component)
VDTVRISTRPDYIDESRIALLQQYSVSIVELGVQSMDQSVLDASFRGHTVSQSEDSVRLLRQRGFTVGIQIMCGLPEDSPCSYMTTVKKVAELAPDFVRIYPTLVISESGLEKLYLEGKYKPLSLLKAVALSSRAKNVFAERGIKVVRMGLQPSEDLESKIVAGPYHPSFGEQVISRNLFRQARKLLYGSLHKGSKTMSVSAADESAFRGPGNANIKRLVSLELLEGVDLKFVKDQERGSVKFF